MDELPVILPEYILKQPLGRQLSHQLQKREQNPQLDFDQLSRAGVLGSLPGRFNEYSRGLVSGLNSTATPNSAVNKDLLDSIHYNRAMMDLDSSEDEDERGHREEDDPNHEANFNDDDDDDDDDNNDNDDDDEEMEDQPVQFSVSSQRRDSRSATSKPKRVRRKSLAAMVPTFHDKWAEYPLPYRIERPNTNVAFTLSASCDTITFPTLKPNESLLFKSNNSIPSKLGVFYYEVLILPPSVNQGQHFPPPNLTLGLIQSKLHSPSKIPGNEPNSFGLSASDGSITAHQTTHRSYSSSFGAGDTIGVGVDWSTGEVWFTKNGVSLGVAFRDLHDVDQGVEPALIPVFGIKGGGSGGLGGLQVNFGRGGFIYDIDGYVSQRKNLILGGILGKEVKTTKDPSLLMKELVSEYFDHLGCVSVAETFQKEVKEEGTVLDQLDSAHLKTRHDINMALQKLDFPRTISLIQTNFPTVFVNNPYLLFRLESLTFLKYIKQNDVPSALALGQELRTRYPDQQHQERINDMTSLLAYPNPEESEFGYLLGQEEVERTNEMVNAEVLKTLGRGGRSKLEKLMSYEALMLKHKKEGVLLDNFR